MMGHKQRMEIQRASVTGHLKHLLQLPRKDAVVMVLGPTTPMSPVLFDYGVDVISGTRVVDTDTVLRFVSQGASFKQIEGVKLLTMTRSRR